MVGGSKCETIGWSSVESIPNELLFKILQRLPAQDIYFGARLVCWNWYNMTRTKYFMQKHLEHTSYGLFYRDKSGDVVFISAREDGEGIDKYKLNYICKKPVWSPSCNGLMLECERPWKKLYYVTNTLTNQTFCLPPYTYETHLLNSSGIGYDASSMTYKVVVSYCDEELKDGCAILTVGVDKSWRRVRTDHLSDLGMQTIMSVPITTEGFIHWKRLGATDIVTLNIETEVIEETPPPIPKVVNNECYVISTGKYLSLFLRREKLLWEVFEMKPKTGEWRKLPNICLEGQRGRIVEMLDFKIEHDDVFMKPCCWLKYPEVLALRIQRVIIFYNLITCKIGAEKLSPFKGFPLVTLHKNCL